jgi:hypothetical protein
MRGFFAKKGSRAYSIVRVETEARRATSPVALLTLNTPGQSLCQPPVGLFSTSLMSSTLKLDGLCRGGKSLKVAMNWLTTAWVGTTRNARSI